MICHSVDKIASVDLISHPLSCREGILKACDNTSLVPSRNGQDCCCALVTSKWTNWRSPSGAVTELQNWWIEMFFVDCLAVIMTSRCLYRLKMHMIYCTPYLYSDNIRADLHIWLYKSIDRTIFFVIHDAFFIYIWNEEIISIWSKRKAEFHCAFWLMIQSHRSGRTATFVNMVLGEGCEYKLLSFTLFMKSYFVIGISINCHKHWATWFSKINELQSKWFIHRSNYLTGNPFVYIDNSVLKKACMQTSRKHTIAYKISADVRHNRYACICMYISKVKKPQIVQYPSFVHILVVESYWCATWDTTNALSSWPCGH